MTSQTPPVTRQRNERACIVCAETNVKLNHCGRCKNPLVFYCSRKCQIKDWKHHKPTCKTKPTTETEKKTSREMEIQQYMKNIKNFTTHNIIYLFLDMINKNILLDVINERLLQQDFSNLQLLKQALRKTWKDIIINHPLQLQNRLSSYNQLSDKNILNYLYNCFKGWKIEEEFIFSDSINEQSKKLIVFIFSHCHVKDVILTLKLISEDYLDEQILEALLLNRSIKYIDGVLSKTESEKQAIIYQSDAFKKMLSQLDTEYFFDLKSISCGRKVIFPTNQELQKLINIYFTNSVLKTKNPDLINAKNKFRSLAEKIDQIEEIPGAKEKSQDELTFIKTHLLAAFFTLYRQLIKISNGTIHNSLTSITLEIITRPLVDTLLQQEKNIDDYILLIIKSFILLSIEPSFYFIRHATDCLFTIVSSLAQEMDIANEIGLYEHLATKFEFPGHNFFTELRKYKTKQNQLFDEKYVEETIKRKLLPSKIMYSLVNENPGLQFEPLLKKLEEAQFLIKRQLCASCKKDQTTLDKTKKTLTCGRCKVTIYCSKECQKRHWKQHKINCKKSKTPTEKNSPDQMLVQLYIQRIPFKTEHEIIDIIFEIINKGLLNLFIKKLPPTDAAKHLIAKLSFTWKSFMEKPDNLIKILKKHSNKNIPVLCGIYELADKLLFLNDLHIIAYDLTKGKNEQFFIELAEFIFGNCHVKDIGKFLTTLTPKEIWNQQIGKEKILPLLMNNSVENLSNILQHIDFPVRSNIYHMQGFANYLETLNQTHGLNLNALGTTEIEFINKVTSMQHSSDLPVIETNQPTINEIIQKLKSIRTKIETMDIPKAPTKNSDEWHFLRNNFLMILNEMHIQLYFISQNKIQAEIIARINSPIIQTVEFLYDENRDLYDYISTLIESFVLIKLANLSQEKNIMSLMYSMSIYFSEVLSKIANEMFNIPNENVKQKILLQMTVSKIFNFPGNTFFQRLCCFNGTLTKELQNLQEEQIIIEAIKKEMAPGTIILQLLKASPKHTPKTMINILETTKIIGK